MNPSATSGLVHERSIAARDALQSSVVFPLRSIEVDDDGKRLRIRGRVSSFFQKQQAQEIVRSVASGIQIVNQIVVGKSSIER